MPHLLLHGHRLNDAYPPMTVPEEEILPDLVRDEQDSTLQRGLEEAEAISAAARNHGRLRRMSPTEKTLPDSSSAAKGTLKDEVNLVNHEEETTDKVATSCSTLGRRRSEKESPYPSHDSQDGSRVWHWKSSKKNSEEDASESHASLFVAATVQTHHLCLHDSCRLA